MILKFCIVASLLLTGCAKSGDSGPPASSPPITKVVVSGVYVIPSYVRDDPYWSIWKVLAEERGAVWYMWFTNRIPASAEYSSPPELKVLANLSQQGTNWGASMMPTKKFLSSPVLYYLGQQAVTPQESDALRISMRSYYETRDRIMFGNRVSTTTNSTNHSRQQPPATPP